ncbi:DUF5060 domain-containing protein [Mucilaginibacter limnophilus]|uniref:DUF5060 domain-containing protein n=1 Tax=Mucilaginibacter limnophilus TaxID=1932778 RepID=A0A3S2X141_9SPHI|nr:DUF5060 domain-containing protein [Mucilaginibacter limnophilus]RVU03004.1 DUF5060 domain-containing protein [Mucilaginibacter limnophilus]
MKFQTLLSFLLLITSGTQAQISAVESITAKPLQYRKTEFNIKLTASWENPYLQQDVALDMQVNAPSGKTLTLPCYYASGESGKPSLWKARFAPQEKGKYSYRFVLGKTGKVVSKSADGYFTVASSKSDGFLHVKNNWVLQFDNGKPFRGIAENICWESRDNDDSKYFKALHENNKYNYEYMLRSFAGHGGNFFRTWICRWNLPIDWKKGFNNSRYQPSEEYFNPSAVQRLDRLVNLSDSLGLYIMLCMGPGAYSTRDGGFSPNAADFFVNPKSKQRYKDRLRYIVARWGYSTSIGAWEFFNEVDNVQFGNKDKPISGDSIVQWHDEMSTYLKRLDPYRHIVTTSISHRDINGLNSLKNIDINQKHIYKNTFIIPETIEKYEQDYGKPYVIGEFGYEYDWSKNFDEFAKGMDSDFKRGLWYGLFSSTPILPMSWWWEYFNNRGTDAYYKNVKLIADIMINAGKGSFERIELSASNYNIKAYGVKCGTKTFIYVWNPSEIQQAGRIKFEIYNTASVKIAIYGCESGKFTKSTDLKANAGKYSLQLSLAQTSDKVFVLSEN